MPTPPVRRRSIRAPRVVRGGAAAVAVAVLSGAALSLGHLASAAPVVAPSAAPSVAPASPPVAPPPVARPADPTDAPFISYVQPSDVLVYDAARRNAGPGASPAAVEAAAAAFRAAWAADHFHGPRSEDLERLHQRELAWLHATSSDGARTSADGHVGAVADTHVDAQADADRGVDPARSPNPLQRAPVLGELKLLVIAVEFDGTDTAENFSHEVGIRAGGRCVTETVTYDGPLHGQIARPGPLDNHTTWRPSFERDFYEQMVFSAEGVTERIRPDLVDPEDGRPGIDIGGNSMANFYKEVSGGKVTFDGGPRGVTAWVKVPHSVGYYDANACRNGRPSGSGLPSNPRFPNGTGQLIADIGAAINAADPDFPWADYDTDGDRVVDHVVYIHAGIDESEGGGVDGNQQIWAHRSSVDARTGLMDDRGTPTDMTDDITIRGYTIQPENLSLGVLVHEFGHDLGLPDLYTTTGDEDVTWWDLMSVGARTGRLNGSDPTHIGAWGKTVLGWLDPVVVTPGADAATVLLGQLAQPPEGSTAAVRVDVPPSYERQVPLVPDSTRLWWSGNDQASADHRLTRDLDLTGATGAVSVSFQLNHGLERDRDYFFVEVSTDGGATFVQTKGFRVGTGQERTTADDYADPNRSLAGYGGLKYGYTGDNQGWMDVYHDLTPYAGMSIQLRLRYATSPSNQSRGVFVDNFAVRSGGAELLVDAVEPGAPSDWTSTPGTFQSATAVDAGWTMTDGTKPIARYYLLEWRNPVGFDIGLKYAYNTIFARLTADGARELFIDRVPSNVPGLLVWLRDMRFGANNPSNSILSDRNQLALPSEGAKGGLLIVDAHPEPLRGPLGGVISNTHGIFPFPPSDSWRGRVQTTNAAFGLHNTAAITLTASTGVEPPATLVMTPTHYAPLPAVHGFHDALGFMPGVEELEVPVILDGDGDQVRTKRYAFADPDGGVVVPAAGYYPPRTPIGFTGLGGDRVPPSDNISVFETMFLRGTAPVFVDIGASTGRGVTGRQSGNPGDHGVQFGFHFDVISEAADGSTGTIRLWRQADDAEATGALMRDGNVNVDAGLINIGGATTMTLYSDFDEAGAMFVADGLSSGAVPVAVGPDEVAHAVLKSGPGALAALAAAPGEAVAVAWAGYVKSGVEAGFHYRLAPRSSAQKVMVRNEVYRPGQPVRLLDALEIEIALRSVAYLPIGRRGE
ncbi:MAG: immune inhibitor A [Ardenticatenales bacterium]|nr:immune inhibitor A [Ardenticatenales bacterium]